VAEISQSSLLFKMSSAQPVVAAVLVICIINLPLIQSSIFNPNGAKSKSIKRNDFVRAAQPTKMQTFKAYAKGYAKAGATMGAVLFIFKAVQLEKLFEMIFGKDTSVEDLQNEIMDKFDEIEELVSEKKFGKMLEKIHNFVLSDYYFNPFNY
jgi:hypothetical protein